jgi:hypothetical protein
MGRDLTKRYSSVFESHRLPQPLLFARDVYETGKWRELSSFLAWEVMHRLHLFPTCSYLRFTDREPLQLGAQQGSDYSAASEKVQEFFSGLGLRATICKDNWKLLWGHRDGQIIGCRYPNDNDLYESKDGQTALVQTFPAPIKAIFVSGRRSTFVCVKGSVYRRAENTSRFDNVLPLTSPESFFRHNNGMTEGSNGTLVIGEYGNVWNDNRWKKLPFLYSSSDDGVTWTTSDFLLRQGTNKHVHVVKYSGLLGKMFVADGDNYKKLWVCDIAKAEDGREPRWKAANRFHIQMGGYTSIVESDGKIFFGTDYQGGTNFIVESLDGRTFTRKIVPDPYRRSPVDNMVLRKAGDTAEIWANLPYSSGASRCLLMLSKDLGSTWTKVAEYSRSTHVVWLISSSANVSSDVYFSIEDLTNKQRAVYKLGDNQ